MVDRDVLLGATTLTLGKTASSAQIK